MMAEQAISGQKRDELSNMSITRPDRLPIAANVTRSSLRIVASRSRVGNQEAVHTEKKADGSREHVRLSAASPKLQTMTAWTATLILKT